MKPGLINPTLPAVIRKAQEAQFEESGHEVHYYIPLRFVHKTHLKGVGEAGGANLPNSLSSPHSNSMPLFFFNYSFLYRIIMHDIISIILILSMSWPFISSHACETRRERSRRRLLGVHHLPLLSPANPPTNPPSSSPASPPCTVGGRPGTSSHGRSRSPPWPPEPQRTAQSQTTERTTPAIPRANDHPSPFPSRGQGSRGRG